MSRRATPEIPLELFEKITAPENTGHAVTAMRAFLLDGDEAAFEYAVALYVASARHRNEAIERVTGALCMLAGELEGPRIEGDMPLRPTRLHQLIFNGILRAFYGDVAVDRAIGASGQRKADSAQHTKSGTWPRKPAE